MSLWNVWDTFIIRLRKLKPESSIKACDLAITVC